MKYPKVVQSRGGRYMLYRLLIMAGLACAATALHGQSSQQFLLNDMSEFRPQAGNWSVVGDVVMDPTIDVNTQPKAAVKPMHGKGTLLNQNDKRRQDHLVSVMEHGDIELDLEVMLPKGSNSGIYLQGRYEIQLLDNLDRKQPAYETIGGIYRNWETEQGKIYMGKAPLVNAAKAPGLWQKFSIAFRAPRFNPAGEKTANARFVRVDLNGVRIHDNIEVPLPTGTPIEPNEKPLGPLMIQGDHGPVALRNLRYRLAVAAPVPQPQATKSSIFVDVGGEPRLLRSFFQFDGQAAAQSLTHAISVGDPAGVNYVYDTKGGNVVAVWRGPFLNVTPMWDDRGNGFSMPRGAVQLLFNNQPLAFLASQQESFPVLSNDVLIEDAGHRSKGYGVDSNGRPVFEYSYQGLEVTDRIRPDEALGLTHEITIRGRGDRTGLYCKLGQGREILQVRPGWYAFDRQYYVRIENSKPLIRSVDGWQELIVPVGDNLEYSILW